MRDVILPHIAGKNPLPTPSSDRARITVVGQVYHQSSTGSPLCVTTRWGMDLLTQEQPYVRQIKVGEDWEALDPGWMIKVSQLVLLNEPKRFAGVPTKKQTDDEALCVVEIGVLIRPKDAGPRDMHSPPKQAPFVVPFGEIPVGQDCRIKPVEGLPLSNVMLRCRKGTTTVTINLFPV